MLTTSGTTTKHREITDKKNNEWWWMNEWRWKWERFLEYVISWEHMSVGPIGVDNNLRWERLKDMIKLNGF